MIVNRNMLLGSDFRIRLITALLGVPAILAAIFIGPPVWTIVVIGTALWCVRELRHMIDPNDRVTLVAMGLITLTCFFCVAIDNYLALVAAIGAFSVVRIVQAARNPDPRHFLRRNFLYPVLGALYVGLPLSLLLKARDLNHGALWTGVAFTCNWCTDGFALMGGRIAGHHKLAPHISPGKTIEGAIIGLASGLFFGSLAGVAVGLPFRNVLLVNAAVAALTIAGDLLESWIKRVFSVKDAGNLLPGHGGLMDRVDGMLLAGPALYLLLLLLGA